ncbi:hypothetical protein [Streptomyces sp. NPDC101165]|uniref:hypothetical protein n=1 Tax=Streptomyces sp. NPDC101165 TaxID=3366119 RepID=UPI00382C7AAA
MITAVRRRRAVFTWAAMSSREDGVATLAGFIGDEGAALGLVEDFHALVAMLAERDPKIVHWRFVQ